MITRFANNPILAAKDVKPTRSDFEVMCAFNAGATRYPVWGVAEPGRKVVVALMERTVETTAAADGRCSSPTKPNAYSVSFV